jgi:hypothetical protein
MIKYVIMCVIPARGGKILKMVAALKELKTNFWGGHLDVTIENNIKFWEAFMKNQFY